MNENRSVRFRKATTVDQSLIQCCNYLDSANIIALTDRGEGTGLEGRGGESKNHRFGELHGAGFDRKCVQRQLFNLWDNRYPQDATHAYKRQSPRWTDDP